MRIAVIAASTVILTVVGCSSNSEALSKAKADAEAANVAAIKAETALATLQAEVDQGKATPRFVQTKFCSVTSEPKQENGEPTLHLWNLKLHGLKTMTARLLIITDGKTQKAAEVEYDWDKWEESVAAATGQLILLVQNGEPFGFKDKRLPVLVLDLQKVPSHSRRSMQTPVFLEGKLSGSKFTFSTGPSTLGRNAFLYEQLEAANAASSFSFGSNLESLIASSKGGNRVLAIRLETTLQK